MQLELCITAYVAHRSKKLQTPRRLIEEIDTIAEPAPRCPSGKFKMHVRIRDARVQQSISGSAGMTASGVRVGTSPAMMKTEGNTFVPQSNNLRSTTTAASSSSSLFGTGPLPPPTLLTQQQMIPLTGGSVMQSPNMSLRRRADARLISSTSSPTISAPHQMAQLVQTSSGRHIILTPSGNATAGGGGGIGTTTTVVTQSGQRLTVVKSATARNGTPTVGGGGGGNRQMIKVQPLTVVSAAAPSNQQQQQIPATSFAPIAVALAQQLKSHSYAAATIPASSSVATTSEELTEFMLAERERLRKERRQHKLQFLTKTNHRRCEATPIYGSDLRDSISLLDTLCSKCVHSDSATVALSTMAASWSVRSFVNCHHVQLQRDTLSLSAAIKTYELRTDDMRDVFNNFVLYVPAVSAPRPYLHVSHPHPARLAEENHRTALISSEMSTKMTLLHPIISAMNTQVMKHSFVFLIFEYRVLIHFAENYLADKCFRRN